jgi:hypothetical protein
MTLPPTQNATGAPKWEPKWLAFAALILAADVVVATLAWFVVALVVG